MTRKKQIIVPIIIIAIGIALFMVFSSMKKPPEEKPVVDNTPIVAVENITVEPMTLIVDSYGMVKPKYETEIVAQVSGSIVELSPEFVRGGFVKKGQLLARIDPSDYEAALIDAQANMASARSALEQERAQGKVAEREWKRITDTSPTELSLRKPQLAQEIARVKAAQAAILRAERNLERTELRAPYDAMIESRHIGLGAYVSVGSQVGKVLNTDIAIVRLPVADNHLKFLKDGGVGSRVELHGTYADVELDWGAEIARSEGVIDSKSRMSYLVAEIDDPYQLSREHRNNTPLRFGTYVTAKVMGIDVESATLVPRYLVTNERVALLSKDSTLKYVPVTIVRQKGANVVISEGLANGDQLIVSALDYPLDGMKLALPTDESSEGEAAETQIASIKE